MLIQQVAVAHGDGFSQHRCEGFTQCRNRLMAMFDIHLGRDHRFKLQECAQVFHIIQVNSDIVQQPEIACLVTHSHCLSECVPQRIRACSSDRIV